MACKPPIPIAIIGIACRLPGNVRNTDDLWELLLKGGNTWSPVPLDRFNEKAFYHPNPDNAATTNHRGGHFITHDLTAFDAPFFGISPVEAAALDPQQRVLLETTYEVFENAGIPIETVRGSNTAVFSAMFTRDYDRNLYKDPLDIPKYHTTGTGEAIIANRISYTFDFKGPSMTLDTGCSGSLVALHQACRSLQLGESTMALASGVSLILSPDHMFGMSNLHMLNDYGRSFSFDERGSGYGRGEGVVTVLLKRLDHAIIAGDRIRSIIRNTAVNQDGRTNGITLPSHEAQKNLQQLIYNDCALDPQKIDFIETHGTGTIAGDLAEFRAIKEVFCGDSRTSDLYIGSIKSNIGHLESASGLAGLIKAVLALEKGVIPPNSGFVHGKRELTLDDGKIKIPSKPIPWVSSKPKRASVNSFGYGGTNAHAVLELPHKSLRAGRFASIFHQTQSIVPKVSLFGAYLPPTIDIPAESSSTLNDHSHSASYAGGSLGPGVFPPQLFVLTAKSEDSVLRAAKNLQTWASTQSSSEKTFRDLAYSLSHHRSIMGWRYSFIARSFQELITSLDLRVDSPKAAVKSFSSHRVAFIFTGQGAQWFEMGHELLHTNSAFAESITNSEAILHDLGASWSLFDELSSPRETSRINESEIAQPASTALQIALVDLLSSFGVISQTVIGHSSGEIAGAYSAGILSQAEALKVSYLRSLIRGYCRKFVPEKGAMLSVGLGEEHISLLLAQTQRGKVSLACVNSPSSTTISGDEDAILEIQGILNESGVFNRRLTVDTAYHSHHMQKVSAEYLSSLGFTKTSENTKAQFISTVTGVEKATNFGSEYWVENLLSTVRFSNALDYYCTTQSIADSLGSNLSIIEIGPHSVLKGPIRETIASRADTFKYSYLPTLIRGQNAVFSILELVGNLFDQGYPVSVDAANSFLQHEARQMPEFLPGLPTYPWDHSNKYWHESRLSRDFRFREHPYHDILGVRVVSSTSLEPVWRHILGIQQLPWLADHVVDGLVIFPGSGYICMAIEAIHQFSRSSSASGSTPVFVLRDISFSKALVIPSAPYKIETQLSFKKRTTLGNGWYEFRVSALHGDKVWHEHCNGLIRVEYFVKPMDTASNFANSKLRIYNSELDNHCQDLKSADIYKNMAAHGNLYGPCFTGIRSLKMSNLKAISYITLPDIRSIMPATYLQPHIIHPATLDVLLHTSLPVFSSVYDLDSVMPISIGKLTLCGNIKREPRDELVSHTSLYPKGRRSAVADILVFETDVSDSQCPVIEISEIEIHGLGETKSIKQDLPRNFSYQMKFAPDIDFSGISANKTSPSLEEYMDSLHFKYSNLKILQANLGSKQMESSVLTLLDNFQNQSVKTYDFADLSDSSFRDVQTRFSNWHKKLKFKKLNIKSDLEVQKLDSSSYDMVILVLDTMDHIDGNSLSNARKLLNMNGRLMLFAPACHFSRDNLTCRLREYSFDAVQFLVAKDESNERAIAISRLVMPERRSVMPFIHVLQTDGTEDFAHQICASLQTNGFSATSVGLDIDELERSVVRIVIDNGQNPFLVQPSSKVFKKFIDLIGRTKSDILWISTHQDSCAALNPEKGLITGFARSASAENEHLKFVTLDIQDPVTSISSSLLRIIHEILIASFTPSPSNHQLIEREYIYRGGEILIPRLIPDYNINTWIAKATEKSIVETVAYSKPSRELQLDSETASFGGDLYFIDSEVPPKTPDPEEIQVSVRAHTVRPLDDVANISTKEFPKRIHQFSGIVSSVGAVATHGLEVGDSVCGWSYDNKAYASYIRTQKENVFRLPKQVPFQVGSTIPFAFMTAYYSLVELAHLQKEQTILIHNATEDTGRAALIIARSIGARIFATVLNAESKEFISRLFQLESENVFYEHAENLKQNVLHFTHKVGVDVVLNPSTKSHNQDSCACLANYGIYIHVQHSETQNSSAKSHCFEHQLGKNATFILFDLDTLIGTRPEKATNLLHKALNFLPRSEKYLNAQNITSIALCNLRNGFRLLSSQEHQGKIVVEMDLKTRVPVISKTPPGRSPRESTLDSNATYIIAGGLGDLGRRCCDLMASRGAKYLVILSRRSVDSDKMNFWTQHLQKISSGCKVYNIACDISSWPKVLDVAIVIEKLGLPMVKGIVQSASVLKDITIERMTTENLRTPLETKVNGTAYLRDAFKHSELDFFIMLSSLSGVSGTMGQANYAAGNVFQDAVAQSQVGSRTHFLSLDLGLIKGTSVYDAADGQVRMQHLIRQGMIPLNSDEVDAVLDYAISLQARNDCYGQIVVGIDAISIASAANPTPTTQSAMFIHVRKSNMQVSEQEGLQNSTNRKKTIAEATTLADVHLTLVEALKERVSTLISLDIKRIGLDVPLLDFGLDSLTAIELKNWIGKEFSSAIQVSEILDEPSISSLAERIAVRSLILHPNSDMIVGRKIETSAAQVGKVPSELPIPLVAQTTMNQNNVQSYQILPLPELAQTLESYLSSARLFMSESQLANTHNAIRDFLDGIGVQLQARLIESRKQLENWPHAGIYLRTREPTHPYGTFYGSHLAPDSPHNQAERAAIISLSAWVFKQSLDSDLVEQDYLNEEPLCMDSWRWLFNASRLPYTTIDKMHKFADCDYFVVLRRGHVFKVTIPKKETSEAVFVLKTIFEEILSTSQKRIPSVATLTADGRNSWAELRETVKNAGPENASALSSIEDSLFVLCLDDEAPENSTERCNRFLYGEPSNRWSDKTLQFIVCENGSSAFVCDHTMLDAASLRQINKLITQAIIDYKPAESQIGNHTNSQIESLYTELLFETNPEIEASIDRVSKCFKEDHNSAVFVQFDISNLNKEFFRTFKIPSKAGAHLVIQLASLLHFGQQHPCWETLTTMLFRQGRIDWMQTVTPAMHEFCASMIIKNKRSQEELMVLLREAVNMHSATMAKIGRGKGFLAHLHALREVIQEDEPMPALFEDSVWKMMSSSSPRKLKTDSSNMMAQEAGFCIPDPEGLLVHYEVRDDKSAFWIQGMGENPGLFQKVLERAAEMVRNLLLG